MKQQQKQQVQQQQQQTDLIGFISALIQYKVNVSARYRQSQTSNNINNSHGLTLLLILSLQQQQQQQQGYFCCCWWCCVSSTAAACLIALRISNDKVMGLISSFLFSDCARRSYRFLLLLLLATNEIGFVLINWGQ